MKLSGLPGTPLVIFPSLFSGQPWITINLPRRRRNQRNLRSIGRKLQCLPPASLLHTSHLKPGDVGSPAKPASLLDHSPIVAHHPPPPKPELNLNDHSLLVSEADPTSISEDSACTVPNLSDCEDVKYESCDYTPEVSYKTLEGNEQWTPVVRRKRTKLKVSEGDSDSDSSGSEVDVSCSRLVEFHKKDGVPGLNIYRRRPTVWTPIALRTRSRSSKT